MYCMRWKSGKETFWSQTQRIGGDGRIRTPRQKAQCKGSVNAAKKWKLHFPGRRGDSQNLWRRTASDNIHLNLGSSRTRRRTRSFSRIIRRTLFSNPSSRWLDRDDAEAQNDFWSFYRRFQLTPFTWNLSETVHAERRIISNSDEVHRRYQNDKYIPGCYVGEKYWRLLERGWRKRIIRCMDKLHKIYSTKREATRRVHLVPGETYNETNNLSSKWCMARYVEAYAWRNEKESETEMGYRETKAPQCQTIERNMNQMTKSSSSQWKPLVESWKFRCQQQCLAKYR